MNYPFVPLEWQDSITQSIYASIIVIIAQFFLTGLFKWLITKAKSIRVYKLYAAIYNAAHLIPFLTVIVITAFSNNITVINIVLIACAALFSLWAFYNRINNLEHDLSIANDLIERMRSAGIQNSVINPTVTDYQNLLKRTFTGFALLGIGAEKLTRDFEIFRNTINRCSSPEKPARFLLVNPDVDWVRQGSTRRGLGNNHFRDLLIKSLKKIARLKKEFKAPIEVRFYTQKPLFRLLLINDMECWFGYYSESVLNSGENEFENRSHTTLIVKRPDDKPPDREFYGALEAHFNDLWDQAEEDEWNFKKYLQ